jgi:hypothetical protein
VRSYHRTRVRCPSIARRESGVCVTVLKAFIDDSGSGGDSPWVVLAGYVGTVEAWDLFDPQWRAVLNAPPRIEYFKASEAESLRTDGQWAGVTEGQRDAKLDALIKVIQRCAKRAVSIRVRQKHYDEVIKGNVPPMWDNPYYFLFMGYIAVATSIEKFFYNDEPTEFVFDNQEQFEKTSDRLYRGMINYERFAGRAANVAYRNDKKILPLQAADLLAWQIRRAYSVPREPRRPQFDSAQQCSEPPYVHTLTRKELLELVFRMDAHAEAMAAALGFPPGTRPWRKEGK